MRSATLLIALTAACSTGQQELYVDSTAGSAHISLPAKPRELPWQTVIAWEPYAGVDPGDLGIGVAYLKRAEDKGATAEADTLRLRATPDSSAPAIGAVLFLVSSVGVTQYAVAAPDSLRPNLVEYGYEESGVPFDSADATGRWVRGILGFARDSTARVGWIDTQQRGVGVVRWMTQLADRPIYFPRAERAAFFASPDSSRPVAVPAGGDDAYAIHPVAARGAWLEVRVVEPSDNCEPDAKPKRTRTLWIRYLDDRGRPNVWYYPRGC